MEFLVPLVEKDFCGKNLPNAYKFRWLQGFVIGKRNGLSKLVILPKRGTRSSACNWPVLFCSPGICIYPLDMFDFFSISSPVLAVLSLKLGPL